MKALAFFCVVLAWHAAAVASDADAEWWRSALVYQIYPRSFKDSNGDGIGDLNGIREKLEYLKDTGVDAVWLSPIFLSPMYDFGYDITDYRRIAPEFGTMADFQNLMLDAKDIGIRIILDFVPNHTGNESEWFIRSARRDPKYENYYVWADGKPDPTKPGAILPPSNWISVFRKSAWQWSPERRQFYLHQFVVGQPDLNYREPKVHQEMKDVLRFWLEKGVSGFRVDAVNHMYEVDPKDFNGQYPDEPLSANKNTPRLIEHSKENTAYCPRRRSFIDASNYAEQLMQPGVLNSAHEAYCTRTTTDPDDYDYLNHTYTKNREETYSVIYDWRQLLDEYTGIEPKLLMTEAYADLDSIVRYYGNGGRKGSVPFNFSFLGGVTRDSGARDIKLVIDAWMTHMPVGGTANWVNGNHDQSRLASRLGAGRVDAMNLLALILPGIAVTYQGEEIGMTDGFVSWKDTKDPQALNTGDPVGYLRKSRDPERTPYHWDGSRNAGFTNGSSTWLPVADNYRTVNLARQMQDASSHYHFYSDLAVIRRSPAVQYGDLDTRALSDSILVVIRLLPDTPVVAGIVNLGDKKETVDLSCVKLLPATLTVVATGVDCSLKKGTVLPKSNIEMSGHCALMLQSLSNCC